MSNINEGTYARKWQEKQKKNISRECQIQGQDNENADKIIFKKRIKGVWYKTLSFNVF